MADTKNDSHYPKGTSNSKPAAVSQRKLLAMGNKYNAKDPNNGHAPTDNKVAGQRCTY